MVTVNYVTSTFSLGRIRLPVLIQTIDPTLVSYFCFPMYVSIILIGSILSNQISQKTFNVRELLTEVISRAKTSKSSFMSKA